MDKIADPTRNVYPLDGLPGAGLARREAAAEEVLNEARSTDTHRVTILDVLRFFTVSAYFGLVLVFLAATRKVRPSNPIKGLARWLIYRLFYRVKKPRVLKDFVPETGHCFLAAVPRGIFSDCESASRVQVYEDGVPLPRPHADHQAIRKQGRGAFSHWTGAIYLSTSDNSDPRTNGRTYTYTEV
jgi:hypothetical protein